MTHVWLAFLPALGLWACYPGRVWLAALAALASAAVGGKFVFDAATPRGRSAAAVEAAASLAGAAYAVLLCRRNRADADASLEGLSRARDRRRAAALALEEARRRGGETSREQREATALYAMIKGLSEALSWEDIKPRLEIAVDSYLGVSDFAIYVLGMRGRDDFHPLSVRNLSSSPGGSWATMERCLQERGLSPDQPASIEAPELGVGVPVRDGLEPLAYFYARVPPGSDPKALLGKALTFAAESSFAFRRVKLFQEVERLSELDGLTGVHRRGRFDERIREEVVRAATFKTTLCLMFLDIDHFKSLNDRYGHPFGDLVLRRVGELLGQSVYETDFVARYGGEEFVVILPRAQYEGARRKAEGIRNALESERFQIALDTVRVTVSIGLAHFPRDAGTAEELVASADQALYRAKTAGRNCVVEGMKR